MARLTDYVENTDEIKAPKAPKATQALEIPYFEPRGRYVKPESEIAIVKGTAAAITLRETFARVFGPSAILKAECHKVRGGVARLTLVANAPTIVVDPTDEEAVVESDDLLVLSCDAADLAAVLSLADRLLTTAAGTDKVADPKRAAWVASVRRMIPVARIQAYINATK